LSNAEALEAARDIWNQLTDLQREKARPTIANYNQQGNYRAELAYLKSILSEPKATPASAPTPAEQEQAPTAIPIDQLTSGEYGELSGKGWRRDLRTNELVEPHVLQQRLQQRQAEEQARQQAAKAASDAELAKARATTAPVQGFRIGDKVGIRTPSEYYLYAHGMEIPQFSGNSVFPNAMITKIAKRPGTNEYIAKCSGPYWFSLNDIYQLEQAPE
jgi:hypothetical protein